MGKKLHAISLHVGILTGSVLCSTEGKSGILVLLCFYVFVNSVYVCVREIEIEEEREERKTYSSSGWISWHYWRWHIRLPKGQEFVLVCDLPSIVLSSCVCSVHGFKFCLELKQVVISWMWGQGRVNFTSGQCRFDGWMHVVALSFYRKKSNI